MYFLQQCGAPAVRSMSIFFSLLIGCTEVTPVGKRIQKKWDLLSGQGGLVALALPFLLGGVAGCLLALWAGGEGAASLKEYLVDYLSLSASGPVTSVPLGQVLWSSLRNVCLALVLGLTALGVAGLPVLFGVRGFLFAFSAACLIRVFGGRGLFPAFVLFGLPALLWAPALFLLGVQSLAGAQQLLRRTWGDGRGTLPFNRGYWLRACVCIGLSLAGGLLEYWVVPVLLRAAARVVL